VCDWYNHFKSRQELLEDEPCSQKTSTSVNVEIISKMMMMMMMMMTGAYQQITINKVANTLGHFYQQRQF